MKVLNFCRKLENSSFLECKKYKRKYQSKTNVLDRECMNGDLKITISKDFVNQEMSSADVKSVNKFMNYNYNFANVRK